MIERLINKGGYDWIWWMDFDTLITNTNIEIRDIIEESLAKVERADRIDYLLTHDWYGCLPTRQLYIIYKRNFVGIC